MGCRVVRWLRVWLSAALMSVSDRAMTWSLRLGWSLSADEVAEIRRAGRPLRGESE